MAEYYPNLPQANRAAYLNNLRTQQQRAVSSTPSISVSAPAGAQSSNNPTDIEFQIEQMRLQNLQLQEQILLQQAQAQAQAQQYLVAQQTRMLQQQLVGMGRSAEAMAMSGNSRTGGYPAYSGTETGYGRHGSAPPMPAVSQAQIIVSALQAGEIGWDDLNDIEKEWLMQQISLEQEQRATASQGARSRLAFVGTYASEGPNALAAAAIARRTGQEPMLTARPTLGEHRRSSSGQSFDSNSNSSFTVKDGSASVGSGSPPQLVLSAPDEAFPTFEKKHEGAGKNGSTRVTVKTRAVNRSLSDQESSPEEQSTAQFAAAGAPAHRHSDSISSISSSEEGGSSIASSHSEVTSFESGTTTSTDASSLESLADKYAEGGKMNPIGLGRPSQAAGLAAALSGAGSRQRPLSGSWGQQQGVGQAGSGLSPFASPFNPTGAAAAASAVTTPVAAPTPVPASVAYVARSGSPPHRVGSAAANKAITVIATRQPKGPCPEAELKNKNFQSMTRKKAIGTLLGHRVPSSPPDVVPNPFAVGAGQQAIFVK